MPHPADLTLVARHVMKLFVERRFEELEAASDGSGLRADDMETAVDDIGALLVMPPEADWREFKVRVVRHVPDAYELTLPLWTKSGRTSHSVELLVHQRNGKPVVTVEEIIVA